MHKSGQGCLWKTSSHPCIPASPLHTTDVIQRKSKGRYSLATVTPQLISTDAKISKIAKVEYNGFAMEW
uniref:Uncharacterized protein n=1 Tax=Octopus bimaculoides TaxID=37653 RepID=A0A0L8HSB2_OCTBM